MIRLEMLITPASSKPFMRVSPSLPAPSTAIFFSFNIGIPCCSIVAMITAWRQPRQRSEEGRAEGGGMRDEGGGMKMAEHRSFIILHPSSLLPHPASLRPHPSALIPPPSSLRPHPSALPPDRCVG